AAGATDATDTARTSFAAHAAFASRPSIAPRSPAAAGAPGILESARADLGASARAVIHARIVRATLGFGLLAGEEEEHAGQRKKEGCEAALHGLDSTLGASNPGTAILSPVE